MNWRDADYERDRESGLLLPRGARGQPRIFAVGPALMGGTAGGGSGYPAVANILSMDFDGTSGSTTFTDDSPYARTFTHEGDAQIDTSQYPGGALQLGTAGDNISAAVGAEMSFSGDFTWEAQGSRWRITSQSPIVFAGAGDTALWGLTNGGALRIGRSAVGYDLTSASTVTVGGPPYVLTKIKAQRISGVLKLYINDVEVASQSNTHTYVFPTPLRIGNWAGSSVNTMLGWLRWVRMSAP